MVLLDHCDSQKFTNSELQEVSRMARDIAKSATQTRQAFAKWGKMVGGLHIVATHMAGDSSIKDDGARANLEKHFAINAEATADDNVRKLRSSSIKRRNAWIRLEVRTNTVLFTDKHLFQTSPSTTLLARGRRSFKAL